MSEFGSVLDDLYAGTATVQIADVAPAPKPKEDPATSFVKIGAVVLVVFAVLFLLSKLTSKRDVVHEPEVRHEAEPVVQSLVQPVKEPKLETNVFSISGIIPIAEEDNVEDHKISADKLDPAIEKYLARE